MKKIFRKNIVTGRGFTLVEMLVAIGIFSVIVAVAVGGFAGLLRTESQISSLIAAESNVSGAIEQMTREIRTGSSFCPLGANDAPLCNCPGTDSQTGAQVCTNLAFVNANGQTVAYALQNGILTKSVDGGTTYSPVTGSDATISYFKVLLFGNTNGDHWTPRVTVSIGVTAKSVTLTNDTANIQTTVSARAIDCDLLGNC